MNQINTYALKFYDELQIDADQKQHRNCKLYMAEAVKAFYRKETKDTAYDIYRFFFECYSSGEGDGNLNFMSLLNKLKSYEENAGTLIHKQRDHFIHSVNVFLLGLAIYAANENYQKAFAETVFAAEDYQGRFSTAAEEFYFRWGIASLCHDIGYPIEIITNQINEFIVFATCLSDCDRKVVSRVEYDNFDTINSIAERTGKKEFIRKYYDEHDTCVYIDLLKPIDLLAHKLHRVLGLDIKTIKEKLDGYIADSARIGRVDHGMFSSILVLKWFGDVIQTTGQSPDRLFYPVLDSASAILLHNFYNIALVKEPFKLPALRADRHPLAFLLILCDELQEWNREPYGDEDRKRIHTYAASIQIENDFLSVTYLVEHGVMAEEFVGKKIGLLNKLLDMKGVFSNGFSVGCDSSEKLLNVVAEHDGEIPSLLSDKLDLLAIAIHNRFNHMSRRLFPDETIQYPSFADLPDDRKYENMRAAMQLPQMLAYVGYQLLPADSEGEAVTELPAEIIEPLAAMEHERWMENKKRNGWVLGAVKDEAKRTTPFMVPYEQLEDAVKELDRDPMRNIPDLVAQVGLKVFKRKSRKIQEFSAEEIEKMAHIIHKRYNDLVGKTNPSIKLVPFEELSEEKQNANRRQARGIINKMSHIGCVLEPVDTDRADPPVEFFSPDTVEMLAVIEHDEWLGEKVENGWVYGPRDDEKKINPYMVPYDQLDERIKEYDRDAVRNIPQLTLACGYRIYRQIA